jgi:hypothetical protein
LRWCLHTGRDDSWGYGRHFAATLGPEALTSPGLPVVLRLPQPDRRPGEEV